MRLHFTAAGNSPLVPSKFLITGDALGEFCENTRSSTVHCCIARALVLNSLEMSKHFSLTDEVEQQGRERLEFDPAMTGNLRIAKHTNTVATNMSTAGFGGAACAIQQDDMEILSSSPDGKPVRVKTIHISCESDTFQGKKSDYAGVIIYQYHGTSEWRTRNGKHCKAGYLVIQDTDSDEVKRWKGQTDGVVHGAVYRNAFGEDVDANVIGEGFSVMKGKFKINSGVFNNPSGSEYHDGRKRMSEVSEYCVGKVVESWKNAGATTLGCRNFTIKELLKGYAGISGHPEGSTPVEPKGNPWVRQGHLRGHTPGICLLV